MPRIDWKRIRRVRAEVKDRVNKMSDVFEQRRIL